MHLRSKLRTFALAISACLVSAQAVVADVSLPNIFGDHMVLQRDQKNRVWGKANAGEQVTVKIAAQVKQATANAEGQWSVELDRCLPWVHMS